MSKLVDLNSVRASWVHRYGADAARRMLAGSSGPVVAYDARRGLGRYGRDDIPDTANGQGGDPDGMEAIKTFLKNRLDPESWAQLCQMMEQMSGSPTTPAQPDFSDDPNGTQDENSTPRPGGKMGPMSGAKRFGQDARGSSYFDAFPHNASVDVS
jgi:hypothetical protein